MWQSLRDLRRLAGIIRSHNCWAFSIAFDGATTQGKSSIDVISRINVHFEVENVHLLAIPMYESHTGLAMANPVSNLLNAMCPVAWECKLVGISTDGADNMTGRVSGAMSRLASETLPGLYRV
jgi:hypothetical protein